MATLKHRHYAGPFGGRGGRGFFLALILFGCSAVLAAAQEGAKVVSEVLSYGEASPAEVEENLKALLSPSGRYVFIPEKRTVMVQDIPERVQMAQALLKDMGKPQPNVRVELSFQEVSGGQAGGIHVRGNVSSGDVRVGNRPYPRDGVVVNMNQVTTTSSTNSGQFLLVKGGHAASIEVARQVPFVDYFYSYVNNLGLPVPAVRWQSVGTRLSVRPEVQGDVIRVEIVPELTTLSGGQYGVITLRQLATVVTVANGVPVQIGGFQAADSQFNVNFFSGMGGARGGSNGSFTLKATVQ